MALTDLIAQLQAALGDAYRLDREMPGGGMSRLFLATERSLNRQVVIKLLPPELANETSAARFKREIDVVAHLQHPHILTVLGAGAGEGLLYYVMPYVAGESLRQRITREGKLPVADALRILREAADALAFAHERGIVHRDIKPENILLEAGHAVITDFGIARALSGTGGPTLTGTGMSVGTPGYMSPEQVSGDSEHIDARTDVYALAIVGYEMLTGRTPFEGASMQAVIAAHLTETPKAVTALRADAPQAVSAAIARALAKSPDERFRSAAEFRDAITTAVAAPAGSPSRRLRLGGLAAVTVVLIGLGYFAARRGTGTVDDNVVAVAPFDVLAADLSLWHDGMVDLLSRNLDGMGPLRTVPPSVVLKGWTGRADVRSGTELGARTGARYAVVGQLTASGADSVRAALTLVDTKTGAGIGEVERRESASSMDRLADSLAISLVRLLPPTRGMSNVRLSSLGTRSLPALKAFLQGESYFRRANWDSATAFYQRAVAQDSNFALAWAGLNLTSGWSANINDARTQEYGARAGSLNRGLGRRDSLLILADSLVVGLTATVPTPSAWNYARRLYATVDTAVKLYPTDPQAWYLYGDVRFHYPRGPGILSTNAEVLAAFDSSIALDSSVAPIYPHLIELATILGDMPRANRYLASALAHTTEGRARYRLELWRAMLNYQAGQPVPAIIDTASYTDFAVVAGYQRTRTDSGEPVLALMRHQLARAGWATAAQTRTLNGRILRQLALRGHIHAAAAVPGAATTGDFPDLMLLGVIPTDSARPAMLPRREADLDQPPIRDFIFWASLGDTASIRAIAAAQEREIKAAAPQVDWALPYLHAVSAAALSLARHDTTEALRRFDAVPDSACYACFPTIAWVHARLLAARGRDREAYRLLAVRDADTQGNVLAVPVAMDRARVAERLGMKREAVDAYSMVVAAWSNADPALQPVVTEARSALKRLGADVATRAVVPAKRQ